MSTNSFWTRSIHLADAPLRWLVVFSLLLSALMLPTPVSAAPAGKALQFDGTNDHVTFGQTRMTPGTLSGTTIPTWNTALNSKLGGSSLTFNGSTAYVTFGNASELGLTNFTIETWFYRSAAGAGTDTSAVGGGGLQGAIPLLTKGRGEGDYSNVDMNYFLGISSTGKIAADYEDMTAVSPNPNNHAIIGTTSILNNTWYHAAATYDGATFSLYLNGNLEASVATTAVPRWDSIQYAGLATGLSSTGVPAGFFAGRLDEARVWNYARSQAEIQASMNSEILVPSSGLIGRWGLNDAAGTTASNLNKLGATSFTLEAWVYRNAGGVAMSTGSLGFDGLGGRPNGLYPVVAKGMGEGETPANVNTNYVMGITADGYLGADFEDTAGGVNRPAWGTTAVPIGGWHHIAATYNGSCWALFVDGNPDPLNGTAVQCPNATPESTSYQRAGLSAGINSTGGLGAGYFSGTIDEARIWNRPLSPTEIHNNLYLELTSGSGLMARWGLNEGTGTTTNSSIGTFPGTLVNGPVWVDGFPLDTTIPAAPAGLTATPGDSAILLSWTQNSELDLAGYNVYRVDTGPTYTKVNSSLIASPTHDYNVTGLTNGVPYTYVVTAVDTSANESGYSTSASATPFVDLTPPAAPTGLTATPGNTIVSLSWTANSEPDLAGYNLYRATTDGGPYSTKVNTTLLTGTSTTDTGLTNGTPHYYILKAVDTSTNESDASSQAAATPFVDLTPPAAPTVLTAAPGNRQVSLSWTAPADLDVAGYNVYRSTSPGVPLSSPVNGGTLVPATTYLNNSGLTNGTPYYYVVTAVDTSTNESVASNEVSATPTTALSFDGSNDYVTFGSASGLGVTNFTLETWFYWTGGGITMTTSSSQGLPSVYPLISKGRGEADGSNVDMNYFLGIDSTTHALAVDFEDMATGMNYPFVGSIPVSTDTWHHAAVTYDSVTAVYTLYLDGVVAGTSDLGNNIIPRWDSVQHAGIASAMTSAGTPAGYFQGYIDEVRIWNVVRTQPQIRATINQELTSASGLVARWGLNEGTGTSISSSIGSFPGTLTNGPTWITPGAPFNLSFDTTPPGAPTGLTATPGNTTVSLNWTANLESDLSGYNIYRTTTSPVALTSPINGGTLVTANTYNDTSLINGQIYYYAITAVDTSLNESAGSSEANATPLATPPLAPTLLSATTTPGLQIDLSWTDNSGDETSFKVERSPDGTTNWTQIGTTGADVHIYNDTGLNPGTQYCYRVRASNSVGDSDYGNVACTSTPGEPNNGLQFGASSAYTICTPASDLNTPTFTVETWFRRDGAGIGVTTGTGGIPSAIPLVTKGTSEDELASMDINYFLGINASTGVLIADFEEGQSGGAPSQNHPVSGTTVLTTGVWYHAAATYDGTTWKLYLNGVLEKSLAVGQPANAVNTAPFSMGTSIRTTGVSQGYFDGTLDEVRVWNYARSQAAIQSSMNSPVASPQTGLLGRWSLNEVSGTTVTSSAGTTFTCSLIGTGSDWVPGSPAVVAHAPTFVSATPADLAVDIAVPAVLSATVSDVDLDNLTVKFYGREKPVDFTIIALPDTQTYSATTTYPNYSVTYNSQTNWIANNLSGRNIVFVTHLGDIVNTASIPAEWTRAVTAMNILEAASIPYGLTVGNHDQNPYNTPGSTTEFNANFGISRFSGRSYYGGHYGSTNDNNYALFRASGMDFILINLETDSTPDPLVLTWVDNLLSTFSTRRAIVVTHNLLSGNTLTTQGLAIFNAIKSRPNLFMMLGGHLDTAGRGTETGTSGNLVYTLRSDYQSLNGGQSGYLRIMTFKPSLNQIQVETYSPTLGTLSGSDNNFTLDYTMAPAGFVQIGTDQAVLSGAGTATVNWAGLDPTKQYEWYATVDDSIRTTDLDTRSFTTAAAVNFPPEITEGSSTLVTMDEDGSPIAFDLTLHATDANVGDILTWSISSLASNGIATASGTGASRTIGYTPYTNYNGSDTFVVQVSDGNGGIDQITVNVTITPVNDAP
jgi:fibronectin type 3 domain-containing protein